MKGQMRRWLLAETMSYSALFPRALEFRRQGQNTGGLVGCNQESSVRASARA